MIKWEKTSHVYSVERAVLSTELPLISEGQALVSVYEGGIPKVKRSTGAASDRFTGIALTPRRTFELNTKTELVPVPTGGGTVLLTRTATGNIGAYNASTEVEIVTSSAAASPTNIQVGTDAATGLTSLTFDPSLAGLTFLVVYAYLMATAEEQGLFGNPYPGFSQSDILGQAGVFKIGRIYVNNFNPAANWWGAGDGAVKLLAGGLFTASNDASALGAALVNVDVFALPNATSPWLGLEIR